MLPVDTRLLARAVSAPFLHASSKSNQRQLGKVRSMKPVLRATQLHSWGNGRITDVAWSPDGHGVAVASALGICCYDTQTLMLGPAIPSGTPVEQVQFLNHNLLAVASDTCIQLLSLSDTTSAQTIISHAQAPSSMALTADAALVAVDSGEMISIYHMLDGALQATLPTSTAGTQGSMAFTADHTQLAVVANGVVQVWQLADQTLAATLDQGDIHATSVAFAPNGQLVIASDRLVQLWDRSAASPLRMLARDLAEVRCIAIAPNGRHVAVASATGIHLLRIDTGTLLRILPWQDTAILRLAFAPDSQTLVAAAPDALHLWNVLDGVALHSLEEHWGSVSSVAFAPDGTTIGVVAGAATLVPLTTDQYLRRFACKRQTSQASDMTFSSDGALLAFATDAQVQIRRRDGTLLHMLPEGLAQAEGLAFSSDGQRLIIVSCEGVHIWGVADGTLLHTLNTYSQSVYDVALARNGHTLATVEGQMVRVWRLQDEALMAELETNLDINSVALAADGAWLAIAADDAIQVWQIDQATRRATQRYTLESGAQRVTFAADGARMASIWNECIQLWDVKDGVALSDLDGHTDIVNSVAFSHDGRRLISGSRDGTVRLWSWIA